MKKFSLEEYLKYPARKITTLDGRPVRIICTDSRSNAGRVIGLVGENDVIYVWDEHGSHKVSENPINDLFFADEEEELTELEKEIDRVFFQKDCGSNRLYHKEIANIARHFFELGKNSK